MAQDNEDRITFASALHDFLEYHETNNSSPGTLDSYSRILGVFVAWLQSSYEMVYVDELRIKHLRAYVAHLQKKLSRRGYPLSDTTINHYALVVSVFCHWMEHEEMISRSVVQHFDLPKFDDKDIPALTHDELDMLLDACEEGDTNKPKLRRALTARNRAIVSVLFDSGIRRSELVGLCLGDVDRDLRLLHVKRKGGKWQQVPIAYDGFKALHEYITKHRPYLATLGPNMGAKKDDPVFLGSRGEPLKAGGIASIFERLKGRVKIDKPVRSHQGRRYMATTQLDAGRNPLDVQRQMGHSTLMMTNRYYSQSVEGLKRSHEKYSPLRKKGSVNRSSGLGSGYYEE